MKKRWNNWYFLYVALAAILLFSLFAVPGIAVGVLEDAKGQVITVGEE